MSKKVYELANELEMGAVDLVEKLRAIGLNVRNHMVTLTDEELAQAQKELSVATAPVKAATKVVKKKVASKVASKKVTKKVIRKSTTDALEVKADSDEPLVGTSTEALTEKTTTTVKKKKLSEERISVDKTSSVEEIHQPVQPVEATEVEATGAESPTDNPSKVKRRSAAQKEEQKEVFKEKMHSFTPIFVPEESEVEKRAKALAGDDDLSEDVEVESDDEEDGKSKKRLGTLAAMVSKKGVAAKSKDITMLRAEEELKYATHLVGRAVYTPAKKKKVYSGPSKSY
jgi:hypothetical protein